MTIQNEQAEFLKCLGEPTRLQILKLLASGEKYVGEIVEALNKEQSLVSHHLRALKKCGIVVGKQKAQRIYYCLADARLSELVLICETIVQGISGQENGALLSGKQA